MRRLVIALSLSFSISLFGAAPVAAAEPTSADTPEVEQARERFRRGAELFSEGSFDASLIEFKRAYELVPNYRVLYNIGQVHLELHDYVNAERAFGDYLSHGGADIPAARRAEVEKQLEVLRGRIGELKLEGNVEGAELSVDRAVIGKLPLTGPIRLNAGTRLVSLQKPGFLRTERTLSIAGGEELKLSVTLERAPEAAPATPLPKPLPETKSESSGPTNTGMWLGLAATAVFVGSAATFGILTNNEDDKLDEALNRYPADRGDVEDTRDRIKLYAALTDASAGAALVSGLVTLYFALSAQSSDEVEAASAAPLRVRAQLVPGTGDVALIGTF